MPAVIIDQIIRTWISNETASNVRYQQPTTGRALLPKLVCQDLLHGSTAVPSPPGQEATPSYLQYSPLIPPLAEGLRWLFLSLLLFLLASAVHSLVDYFLSYRQILFYSKPAGPATLHLFSLRTTACCYILLPRGQTRHTVDLRYLLCWSLFGL
ncbi:uncharacterized protein BCR38DRAFT_179883 [Pseudomassariella vexata]|uniref:Uncharacterized protein n=1 Tax=Pseudomassariella vexata TaxID=1141098 RepID=A0A1Y2E4R3_9PEZI|nr:uncharacterized protein BCR38DRAFT_179883 [Pseudomassariella vexata]ORY66427.1 hypothetical protein BCR38DRAFT_179883 [Pseudomassariella vexata]